MYNIKIKYLKIFSKPLETLAKINFEFLRSIFFWKTRKNEAKKRRIITLFEYFLPHFDACLTNKRSSKKQKGFLQEPPLYNFLNKRIYL